MDLAPTAWARQWQWQCLPLLLLFVPVPVCSYHTIPGKAVAAADLKDGQELTTISQHKLTVKVDK
jgi:hypothetical protein